MKLLTHRAHCTTQIITSSPRCLSSPTPHPGSWPHHACEEVTGKREASWARGSVQCLQPFPWHRRAWCCRWVMGGFLQDAAALGDTAVGGCLCSLQQLQGLMMCPELEAVCSNAVRTVSKHHGMVHCSGACASSRCQTEPMHWCGSGWTPLPQPGCCPGGAVPFLGELQVPLMDSIVCSLVHQLLSPGHL